MSEMHVVDLSEVLSNVKNSCRDGYDVKNVIFVMPAT